MDNLNEFKTESNNTKWSCGNDLVIESIFTDIKPRLINLINEHKDGLIFGSIAWLTDFDILDALANTNCQILVQKEDFLRPDMGADDYFKRSLRKKYSNLKFEYERHDLKKPISDLSICIDPVVDAVRCVGNHNRDKKPASPRAHNKFLVFCSIDWDSSNQIDDSPYAKLNYEPIALWTGSFNFSNNAGKSLENVLYIEDFTGKNPIINSYLREHHEIFKLSEPLDWETDWIQPQYRIGT